MEDAEAKMEEIASRANDTTLPENNPLQLLGLVEVRVLLWVDVCKERKKAFL